MQLITTTPELEQAIASLTTAQFVTVDTEFIRETTYWPQLCLIQIASVDHAYLIDPLSKQLDLQSFFALMVNPNIVKVFHAARQDLEIIYHLSHTIPTPLFDTQVAAMVCGFGDSVSYDQLVSKLTGQQLDKSSRFTDWSHRPLSDKQSQYALADVTWLRDVYVKLKQQLDSSGRNDWLIQEMQILSNPQTYDLPLDEAWKKVKGNVKRPRELAVLQQVAAWREKQARLLDQPRRRVLKDEALIEIAIQQPQDPKALGRLRSLNKGWEKSDAAKSLLAAIDKALAIPNSQLPQPERNKPLNKTASAALEMLKLLLRLVCDEHGVATKIVASNADLEKLAQLRQNADIPVMSGWRFDLFGRHALALLNGELAIAYQNDRIKYLTLDETSLYKSDTSGEDEA